MPSRSPGRGGRVVAETESSSPGTRSSRPRISVPFPTPEGPVMTKTCPTWDEGRGASKLTPQHRDELRALALGQAADGLARRDTALREDLVGLHAPVLGNGQQHVEHLGRLDVGRRVEQELVDRKAPGPQGAVWVTS